MTQPTSVGSTPPSSHSIRSLSSSVSRFSRRFITIPPSLTALCVLCSDYAQHIWKLLVIVYGQLRYYLSSAGRRKVIFFVKLAQTEPDAGLITATVVVQLIILCLAHAARGLMLALGLIPIVWLQSWAHSKEKSINGVLDRLEARAEWAVESTNHDFVMNAHELKDTAIRRTRRVLRRSFEACVYAVLPSTIAHKVLQYLSILCVWRWTSLDCVWRQNGPSASAKKPLRAGFVRVRLGFPTRQRTADNDQWGLSTEFYLMDDFPLESDGSLHLLRVVNRWGLDDIQILDPNRFEPFQSAESDKLSPIAINVLAMRDGHLTIVEKRSPFTLRRIALRMRLLSCLPYYLIRVSLILGMVFGTLFAIGYSFLHVHKWYTVVVVSLIWLSYEIYEDMKRMRGVYFRRGSMWPNRYPRGYIRKEYGLYRLWGGRD